MKRVLLYGESAKNGTGIARYVQTIAKGIQQSEPCFDYQVAVRNFHSIPNLDRIRVAYRTNRLKGKLQHFVRKLTTGDELLFGRSDVVHEPNYNLCKVSRGTKVILTVHDVGWRIDATPYGLTEQFISEAEQAIKRSSIIITPSQSVKNDLVRLFGINEDHIHVIYHGVDAFFFQRDTPIAHRAMPERYWLFVGTALSRKNLERVIGAIAMMHLKLPLILTGERTPYGDHLARQAKAVGVEVMFFNRASDAELRLLYRRSTGLIYPSLWEGFGLPLIEAAAAGTIVITSDNTAMKEIAADYALLVNPTNVKEIAMAMQYVLEMDQQDRQTRIVKGKEIVKSYTWERSIQSHIRLYEML
ncbi:MAG: glycosyltransferase family 1 protein [Candidatus Cohnella colombiensis]|uniref:Glycosyltransferase family 1 protein n=1 Tax=Candidatus Cohnella colombiensis TaxID=3121368 RepID=A0AA95JAX7_9BACL|nr:MAG: glycosyltransferase family 1 protein [Cohnella sp.]